MAGTGVAKAVRLARLVLAAVLTLELAGLAVGPHPPLPVGWAGADPAPAVAAGPVFDDFRGPAGSAPNPDIWGYDIGSSADNGWERGSLETYTDSADNVRLDGQGHLVIQARKSGTDYTSARLVTRGKLDFLYGTVTARIKVPSGQGIWPAFWMLGSNIDDVGWPQSGEIDLMELINTGTTYHVSLHGPGTNVTASGPIADLTNDFHNYWMTRQKDSIAVGVDGTTLAAFTPSSLPTGAPWVFNDPMFVLLNVAVGGDWPGAPDDRTQFPATMLVEWFRFDPATS